MGKGYEQTIHRKKKTQMALIHFKRCSTLHRREMQIKTTVRYHFIPIRWGKTQSLTMHSCFGEVGSLSHTAGGNAKCTTSLEGQRGSFHQDYKCVSPLMWRFHFWGFIL